MWVFGKSGFYSVVLRDGKACVRSRCREDLEEFIYMYCEKKNYTILSQGMDYQFRIFMELKDFAEALREMARDIDYPNFKDEIKNRFGRKRAEVYGLIWAAMATLEMKDLCEGEE